MYRDIVGKVATPENEQQIKRVILDSSINETAQAQGSKSVAKKAAKGFELNELWVLYYFYTGLSVKKMSLVLGMSIKMISYYKRKVMRRLQLKSDKELSVWLAEKKITI